MCKLCWVLLVVLVIGVSVAGYNLFVGPAPESSADGRRVIRLSEQERGLVLIVELLNSAVETIVDRVSPEYDELAGRAKDMGSAAVLLSLIAATAVWVYVLYQVLF